MGLMAPRYLSRIENADSTVSITLPRYRAEYEQEQPLVHNLAALTGADYSYDQMGLSASVKGNGIERVRFLEVGQPEEIDAAIDDLKALSRYGRLKIFTTGEDDHQGGTERWAWARMQMMPSLSLGVTNRQHAPVSLAFERLSNFFAAERYDTDFNLSGSDTITVENFGTAPVYDAEFLLSGTFSNPVIFNTTTVYRMESTRDGAGASDILRFMSPRFVDFSSDSGVNWAGDYANYVRTRGQIQLMKLDAGINQLTITGASSAILTVRFWPAFH